MAELIRTVCDGGTFVPWVFEGIEDPGAGQSYVGELAAARERTGNDESVLVGEGTIGGHRVALILSDFDFLAGSVGTRACRLVVGALERARELRLPVFASPSSGGTRMQEGTPAFVLMVDVAAAVQRLRDEGSPVVVWLRNPTTGGVMATWGSLGTITIGEPGALAGFLGPRVFEMLNGKPFPAGVQRTENLAAHGVIDQVVARDDLPDYLARALAVCAGHHPGQTPSLRRSSSPETGAPRGFAGIDESAVDPWDAILSTRDPNRPGVRELLATACDVTELHGTGEGERSEAVVLALARFGSRPCVLIGQDRAAQAAGALINPAALRTARRGIAIAAELGLPIVTVIDTAGAELSAQAEESALAGEIARSLATLTTTTVPTLSVLLGMGCGGGALALLPADRVLAAQRAWLSPLPLEGASVIRHRTPERAPQMARDQQVVATVLAARGIVDVIVPEYPDAAQESGAFIERVSTAIAQELGELRCRTSKDRLRDRRVRYGGPAAM